LEAPKDSSLRNVVLTRVRADIVSGHSAPGTMYSVPSLASELGVSTTPVREALLALASDGLLTPMRNRGFRVEETSLKELSDLFALRVLIECYAMESLAETGLEDTGALRQLADEVGAAVEAKDSVGYIETDRNFHLALVARVGNPRLTKLVKELRDGMRLHGMDSPAGRERQIASLAEHYQLIELAVARDRPGVLRLMKHHIISWEPVFTEALRDRVSGRV
jgi:DNA-binding GntR family transcriptional regulator